VGYHPRFLFFCNDTSLHVNLFLAIEFLAEFVDIFTIIILKNREYKYFTIHYVYIVYINIYSLLSFMVTWRTTERPKKFNELVKNLKDKKFKYVHKEEEVIDWGKYDKAQIHEVNDMLLLIADYVDEATKRLGIVENWIKILEDRHILLMMLQKRL